MLPPVTSQDRAIVGPCLRPGLGDDNHHTLAVTVTRRARAAARCGRAEYQGPRGSLCQPWRQPKCGRRRLRLSLLPPPAARHSG